MLNTLAFPKGWWGHQNPEEGLYTATETFEKQYKYIQISQQHLGNSFKKSNQENWSESIVFTNVFFVTMAQKSL